MNLSEFEKGDFWPQECPYWTWKKKVTTPVGEFGLTLVFAPGDKSLPDGPMFECAEELIAFTKTNIDQIGDLAHAFYRIYVKNSPEWVQDCDMPLDVSRQDIWKYLEEPVLNVMKEETNRSQPDAGYTEGISLHPQWDEEHGLDLDVCDGKIVMINMEPFRFENGVLMLGDE